MILACYLGINMNFFAVPSNGLEFACDIRCGTEGQDTTDLAQICFKTDQP
jgi:hypothetical protein